MIEFDSLIGKRLVKGVNMMDDGSVSHESVQEIARVNGLREVDVVGFGAMGDMQFRDDRLKVYTNKAGVIERAHVG